jgi:hypothetical protein
MLGLLITLIVGLAAVSIFMLSEYKDWYETYKDSEDEK